MTEKTARMNSDHTRDVTHTTDTIDADGSQLYREPVVTLENLFHGPLSVLLALALREEITPHEIPLQMLVQQYFCFENNQLKLHLHHGSDFISSCSTLHYLKSASLIAEYIQPEKRDEHIRNDEDDTEIASAEKLMQALYEYGELKQWAQGLSSLEQEERKSFSRPEDIVYGPFNRKLPPETPCTVDDLARLFQSLLQKRKKRDFHHVEKEEWTIEDAMSTVIEKTIAHREQGLSFFDLFIRSSNEEEEPIERSIALFLALLELIKRNLVAVIWKEASQMTEKVEEKTALSTHPVLIHRSYIEKRGNNNRAF